MRTALLSLFAAFIGAAACPAIPMSAQHAQAQQPAQTQPGAAALRDNYDPLLDLPPLPNNKVTLIGGTVASLDEVMNRMSVQPFGQKSTMEVAFDTRTHFFQDGRPISYRDIRQGQRVYLDTMLNGSKVFAKQIWIQSSAVSGLSRGQIVNFDPQHKVLTIRDELSSQAVKMQVTPTTVIRNVSQTSSTADLVPGALVSVQFGPQRELREVTVSARPGAVFSFAGRITYLDLSRKLIAVDNNIDRAKYDIAIDAVAPSVARELHQGDEVNIDAVFDGKRYAARRIDVTSSHPGTSQP